MAAIAGFGGSVTIGSHVVAELGEWDLTADRDLLDTSVFGSSWKQQTYGQGNWSGKASGYWDMTDTLGQVVLQNDLLNGTTGSIQLTANGTNNYTGTILIKEIAIKAQNNAIVTIDISFEGTGALSYA